MIQRASHWTVAEIARATNGQILGDASRSIAGVSTDTRDVLRDQLFVALVGENFDAHNFLGKAREGGAEVMLVSKLGLETAKQGGFKIDDTTLVVVEDTLFALGELARAHRRRLAVPTVALTGSNGKTTTKEMIAAIFGASRSVLKTEGNLNNLIGVPMTLLGLTSTHRLGVVEMGMNTKGEIKRYAEIAEPTVGMVLNVGPAHIGMLGSLQAIGDAKGELYFGLDKDNGVAIVNTDDPEVVRVAKAANVRRQRTFGRAAGADVRLLDYEATDAGGKASYEIDGKKLEIELAIPGAHNAMNAAGAIALATATAEGITPATLDEVRQGLAGAVRVARRMVFESVGRYLLVDDCYNANSASMLAAIETVSARVKKSGGRFVALLGEMRELGDYSNAEHIKVGDAVVRAGAAVVAAFGAPALPIADRARAAGITAQHEASDVDALWTWLRAQLRDGDAILVKGSRGAKMERFIERLRKEGT